MRREAILQRAAGLVSNDRNEQYGDFGEQMCVLAQMASALLGKDLCDRDIAMILLCLKLKRMTTSEDIDSETALCGYAALYAEYFKG